MQPILPNAPQPQPLALPDATQGSGSLSRLGSWIDAGSADRVAAELAAGIDWRQPAAGHFWKSFAWRIFAVWNFNERAIEGVRSALLADAGFRQEMRRHMFDCAPKSFFLGQGLLELQLGALREEPAKAATRRLVSGIAREYANSGWFCQEGLGQFGPWPLAQWLSGREKQLIARDWARKEPAKSSPRLPGMSMAAKLASLRASGWIDEERLVGEVDRILLEEDAERNPADASTEARAVDAALALLGAECSKHPYFGLWAAEAEKRAGNKEFAQIADAWRPVFGRLKAMSERVDVEQALSQGDPGGKEPAPGSPGGSQSQSQAEEGGVCAPNRARRI